MFVDSSNSIYIADYGNNRVQRWLPGATSGTTVAGQASGTSGSAANLLNRPTDVVVDSGGNVYVADSNNHRIQYWANGASSGITVAGISGRRRLHAVD